MSAIFWGWWVFLKHSTSDCCSSSFCSFGHLRPLLFVCLFLFFPRSFGLTFFAHSVHSSVWQFVPLALLCARFFLWPPFACLCLSINLRASKACRSLGAFFLSTGVYILLRLFARFFVCVYLYTLGVFFVRLYCCFIKRSSCAYFYVYRFLCLSLRMYLVENYKFEYAFFVFICLMPTFNFVYLFPCRFVSPLSLTSSPSLPFFHYNVLIFLAVLNISERVWLCSCTERWIGRASVFYFATYITCDARLYQNCPDVCNTQKSVS